MLENSFEDLWVKKSLLLGKESYCNNSNIMRKTMFVRTKYLKYFVKEPKKNSAKKTWNLESIELFTKWLKQFLIPNSVVCISKIVKPYGEHLIDPDSFVCIDFYHLKSSIQV